MPLRLGDGTTIPLQGFQEVREGDGTVLYSATSGEYNVHFEDAYEAENGFNVTVTDSSMQLEGFGVTVTDNRMEDS